MLPSGLTSHELGLIWKLSALRKAKSLDITEFSIAKFLVEYKLSGGELPELVPWSLIPFGNNIIIYFFYFFYLFFLIFLFLIFLFFYFL